MYGILEFYPTHTTNNVMVLQLKYFDTIREFP